MQTTQMACPHCGSMINFGSDVAPGTPVTCLICTQVFAAAPIAAANAVPAKPKPAAPKPPTGILANGPQANAKPGRPSATRQPSQPVAPTAAPGKGKAARWAVALGLLILLATGAGFAISKLDDVGVGPAAQSEPSIAANQQPPLEAKGGETDGPSKPVKAKDTANNKLSPPLNGSAGGDDPGQKKESNKVQLKRKPSTNPGGKEPELDPISTVEIPAPSVPGVEPARIKAAVEKGVAYLKQTQGPNGAWFANGYPVGATALGGLTLVECKVPANDLHVQRAASFVRTSGAQLSTSYEISLAILFLDRLGEPRDRALIQALALRLLAGQKECGGWSYDCPLLNGKDMYQLYTFLRSHQPLAKKKKGPDVNAADKNPNLNNDSIDEFGKLIAESDAANNPNDAPPADKNEKPGVKPKPMRPDMLAPHLRTLPVVRNQQRGKGDHFIHIAGGAGDNSNTQFALLALWAARRHDVATDTALLSAYQRFVMSQDEDSGWHYVPTNPPSGPSHFAMVPVGLLGLAMGHGVAPDVIKRDPDNPKEVVTRPALQDPKIINALKCLAKNIDEPSADKDNVGRPAHMYFLWSIERVAMLYDLAKIDGKDWYGWGAQKLLKHQSEQGDWPSEHYPGQHVEVNTCFALLFLKRSNLAQDLTLHLRLATKVRDLEK